jgi:mRNA interferase MazF
MSIERWSVWLADLDPVVGSEQGKARPVLVISRTKVNDILRVVNVLPITSRKAGRKIYPNEALLPVGAASLTLESIVMCYQVRTLDKQRLKHKYGMLVDAKLRQAIIDALIFQLEIST